MTAALELSAVRADLVRTTEKLMGFYRQDLADAAACDDQREARRLRARAGATMRGMRDVLAAVAERGSPVTDALEAVMGERAQPFEARLRKRPTH